MKLAKFNIFTLTLVLLSSMLFSQKKNKDFDKANEKYTNKKYEEAILNYNMFLKNNPTSIEAKYNLANALYKSGKYEEAVKLYEDISDNKKHGTSINHNLGNSYLKLKKIDESIEAYKKALRANPKNFDTKYNLSYAMKMKKNQNKKDQNKDKKQQQNQNKKNKEQQKQQKQNKKNEDKKNEDKKDNNKNQQNNIDKQKDQILKAIESAEKETQKKAKKVKGVGKYRVEKDW